MTALRGLLAQVAALAATAGLKAVLPDGLITAPAAWLLLHLALVAGLTALLRLPWWWWPIQLALPVAVVVANGMALPAWLWGALLGAGLLVFGGGLATRVPLYLSGGDVADHLDPLLPPGGRLIDLGCGTGTVLVALRRRRPDAHLIGVEASLLTWLLARWRHRGTRLGSLWRTRLEDCDVAYAFLSSEPMPALWARAAAQMRTGTWFVSNTFAVPGVAPTRTVALAGRADAVLYCYRMPGPSSASPDGSGSSA